MADAGTGKTLSVDALEDRVRLIFLRAGMAEGQAGPISRVIVAGERDGCKSHGIYRIAGVLRTLKAGKVNGAAVPSLHENHGSAIIRVDARGGFSNAAFELGLPHLAEQTRRTGFAAMVINDCCHFAALWPEVEQLTSQGLAALIMCPSYATVAPFGGTRPLLGTNPLAFGWPRPKAPPFVFDFATSMAARGEIELHRRAGKSLPLGWALDAEGKPTTEPVAALGGAMLPFGGHKGAMIGTMIELLAGVMIGDLTSAEALDELGTTTLAPSHGELVLAFSPERFAGQGRGDPLARAEVLFDAMLGQGARLPSQRRFDARAKSDADGIHLNADELADLDRFLDLGPQAVPC